MKKKDLWKEKLTPEQYHILREKGTEAPFTGKLLHNKENGVYKCAACGQILFSSDKKYDSGSGWPSFYDIAQQRNVILRKDNSLGMNRIEAVCNNCGGHLGHVFEDGPKTLPGGRQATGKRYCINSCALDFEQKQ